MAPGSTARKGLLAWNRLAVQHQSRQPTIYFGHAAEGQRDCYLQRTPFPLSQDRQQEPAGAIGRLPHMSPIRSMEIRNINL